jgi:predicted CXXCH cytochrome family protein
MRSWAVAVFFSSALVASGVARAETADNILSEDDQACLECHGSEEGAAKNTLDDRKPRVINPEVFAHSVHGTVGCDGCHPKIKLPAHPRKTRAAKDPGKPAADANLICRSCHEKVVKAHERSIHASKRNEGDTAAPTCSDCHTPHAVTPASVQDGPKNVCNGCHNETVQQHQRWLSNAERHLQTVACAACHAPDALRRIDLRIAVTPASLTKGVAGRFEKYAKGVDKNRDGLDALEFRDLLAAMQADGAKPVVRGRLELRGGVQAHAMPDKSTALRECFDCHDDDAAPFKSVVVSMLDEDGAPVRYDAQRDILTSAVSAEALKGFYAIGGTRIAMLDLLLALGFGVGIAVPALHLIARRYFRRPSESKDSAP